MQNQRSTRIGYLKTLQEPSVVMEELFILLLILCQFSNFCQVEMGVDLSNFGVCQIYAYIPSLTSRKCLVQIQRIAQLWYITNLIPTILGF
jgi:hypothetical protein